MKLDIANKPLVSIITPAYNVEKFIGETIESVINQTYKNWEMLIADDSSTDRTLEIASLYSGKDSKVKVFKLRYNSGRPAVPRNYLVKKALGKYLAFLDADDFWLKNKLGIQIDLMEKKTAIDISYGLARKMHNNFLLNTPFHRVQNVHTLQYVNPIPILTVMIKKDALLKAGLFTEDSLYRGLEDWDLWIRLARSNYKFYFIRKTLALYRVVEGRVSSGRNYKARAKQVARRSIPLHYQLLQGFIYRPSKIIDFIWFSIKRIVGIDIR